LQVFGGLNAYLVWCGLGCVTVAPWIAARGDRLSWKPGEMSICFAVLGVALLLFNGFIARPGEPGGEIHLAIGYPIAVLAMLAITYSSARRAAQHRGARRPAGTIG
jgi:hypothetical protein